MLVTGVVWSGPPIIMGVVINRMEKVTFMKERVIKILGFLTSSGVGRRGRRSRTSPKFTNIYIYIYIYIYIDR